MSEWLHRMRRPPSEEGRNGTDDDDDDDGDDDDDDDDRHHDDDARRCSCGDDIIAVIMDLEDMLLFWTNGPAEMIESGQGKGNDNGNKGGYHENGVGFRKLHGD